MSSSFDALDLPRPLIAALARQGISTPFPIQVACIPDAMAGRDVLGRCQTGSGKTLAFGLPLLARTAGRPAATRRPRALILVPTRELAHQVRDVLEPLGRGLSLRTRAAVGGTSFPKQVEQLKRGVDVLVATPGRLADLIRQGACSLADVEIVVLDEADQMADMGFLPEVRALMNQVPAGGQRLLFSATLDREVDTLVAGYLADPVTHALTPASAPVETMDHHALVVSRDDKLAVTAAIANREGRTLLFARTRHGVDRLATQLGRLGVRAGVLHGGKAQGARTRALAEFRDGSVDALIATDVAARGIHVDDVSLVLHVDPPADAKHYLHRAGRTARGGGAGTVVTLITSNQVRAFDTLSRQAGVRPKRTSVTATDPALGHLTGARTPAGRPVADQPPAVSAPTGQFDSSERTGGRKVRRPGANRGQPHRSDGGRLSQPGRNGARGSQRGHDGARRPQRRGRAAA